MAQKKITRTSQFRMQAEYILDISTDTVYDTVAGAVVDIKLTAKMNGAKVAAIALPENAVVESARMNVLTAFDHATTATVAIGDTVTPTRYLGVTTLKATGITNLVPTEYLGLGNPLLLTFAATGADGTVGKFRLTVDYTISGRANEQFHYVAN